MPFIVGQLIYASFPSMGCRVIASEQVPASVQQIFVEEIVHQQWDVENPLPLGYRTGYLHQISADQTLFGWMYNDAAYELGPFPIPYFICYFLDTTLNGEALEAIFHCLERGPIAAIERQTLPPNLPPITIPDSIDYPPTHLGVPLPSSSHARCRLLLYKGTLLSFCIPVEPDVTDEVEEADVTEEAKPNSTQESELSSPVDSLHRDEFEPSEESTAGSEWISTLAQGIALSPVVPLKQPEENTALPEPPSTKVALLIGVSDYGSGFNPLPGVPQDIAAMKEVLEHPDVGGFNQVRTLLNPDPQLMSEAIEALFSDRSSNQLTLLYFSGYGSIVDDHGKFGLTTGISRRGPNNRVIRSTVITVDFLDDVMRASASEQQIVILDCSLGYLETPSPSDRSAPPFDLSRQLKGPNRTILAASTFTHPPQVDKGGDGLSAYTFYLVEGLATGMADFDGDGMISVRNLHDYARGKVRQASPALEPTLYGDRIVSQTQIATAPLNNPGLRYRREVERLNRQGQLQPAHRTVLDVLQQSLNLTLDEAAEIESEVIKPHQEFQDKLHAYAIAFAQITQQGSILTEQTYRQCQHAQQMLGLTDLDTAPVDAEIVQQLRMMRSPQLGFQDAGYLVESSNGSLEEWKHQFQPFVRVSQAKLQAIAKRFLSFVKGGSSHIQLPRFPLGPSSGTTQLSLSHRRWVAVGMAVVATIVMVTLFRQCHNGSEARTHEQPHDDVEK